MSSIALDLPYRDLGIGRRLWRLHDRLKGTLFRDHVLAAIGTPTSIGTATAASASNVITMTVTASVSAGDFIIVATGLGATSGTVTFSDSAGNTWATNVQAAPTWVLAIGSCKVTNALTSGVSTITATISTGTPVGRTIGACKVTGLDTTTHFDVGATTTGTVVGWDSGNTATLATADELLIGACVNDSNTAETSTPGAGYTELFDVTNGSAFQLTMEYKIVAVNTADNADGTWTNSGSRTWRAGVAAYKGAAGAAAKSLNSDERRSRRRVHERM